MMTISNRFGYFIKKRVLVITEVTASNCSRLVYKWIISFHYSYEYLHMVAAASTSLFARPHEPLLIIYPAVIRQHKCILLVECLDVILREMHLGVKLTRVIDINIMSIKSSTEWKMTEVSGLIVSVLNKYNSLFFPWHYRNAITEWYKQVYKITVQYVHV